MGKLISVRIPDETIWFGFKDFVLKKHGKLHTVLAEEVAMALEAYLKTQSTHTHYADPPSATALSQAEILKKEILKIASPGASLAEKHIGHIITTSLGIHDRRSIRNKIEALIAVGLLQRDWSSDSEGKMFKIKPLEGIKCETVTVGRIH